MHKLIKEDIQRIVKAVDLSPLNGSKILITGASGLLGTYFVACLKELEYVDIYTTSRVSDVDVVNHRKCDLSVEMPQWSSQFDYIIHAAGYGQPAKFMWNPAKTILINTLALFNLARHLKADGKLLFISTSEIYSGLAGSCKEGQVGTTNTTHPRSSYIEGKRCGEAIISILRNEGIDAKSARLALAYGPGTKRDDLRVLNEFIQCGIQDGRVVVNGDSDSERIYCYISDAVEMLWNILLYGKEPIYNVGGFGRITIGALAHRIAKILGINVKYPNTVIHDGAPTVVDLDIALYAAEFGCKTFIALPEGLRRTVEYQKELYNEQ